MKYLDRILGSSWLLLILIAVTASSGTVWFRNYRSTIPPDIKGVNWPDHPNSVLLLVPKGDCGCGMKPLEMAREAAAHHVDFVGIADAPNDDLEKVRSATLTGAKVIVSVAEDPALIKRYCSGDKATALRIKNGHIDFQVEGNLPSDFFERF